jgi:hypothetical protein
VVIEVLVAQSQGVEPLAQQLHDRVLHRARLARVLEAASESLHDPTTPIHL